MLDHFQMGPNLVRGFAPAGIGPRDTTVGSFNDALGGTMFWGASVEAQAPLYFMPKEIGIKFAVFADAGSLWSYKGPTVWTVTGETLQVARQHGGRARRSAGPDLGFTVRTAAFRYSPTVECTKSELRPRSNSASAAARSSDLGRDGRHGTGGMSEPIFFEHARRSDVGDIAALTGATPPRHAARRVESPTSPRLDRAVPPDIEFLRQQELCPAAAETHAGACFDECGARQTVAGRMCRCLVTPVPYRAFIRWSRELFPHALRPSSFAEAEAWRAPHVHPTRAD